MSGATFLLLPGAGGAAWYWHLVVPELRRRGHDVVAVDLPGDDESAGQPEYVSLAVAAAGDPEHLVVVGQSMGAFTAVAVCDRITADLLVLVNPMIPAPGETVEQWPDHVGHDQARRENDLAAGRDPDAEIDLAVYFMHDVPPAIAAEGAALERNEADAAFRTPLAVTAWPDVPTRVIVGRDDRLFPVGFQRALARDRLGVDVDEVPGGHLAALSQPVELADRLHRYWVELGPS